MSVPIWLHHGAVRCSLKSHEPLNIPLLNLAPDHDYAWSTHRIHHLAPGFMVDPVEVVND